MINATKVNEKMALEWRMHDKCTKVDEKMAPKWRMHDKCTKVEDALINVTIVDEKFGTKVEDA
jgi:hypothetical protein